MKRMMLLLLCVMLAMPVCAMADGTVKNFTLQGYEMGFSYSFDVDEEYVVLEFATDKESGRMVLRSEDGHFEGEGILQCTYDSSKLRATVKTLKEKDLAKASATIPKSAAPEATVKQEAVEKKAGKITDLVCTPILGGAHIEFTAMGHESVLIKYRSTQQKGETVLYPGENYTYSMDIPMPYTYNKQNIYIDVCRSSGSVLAEGQTYCGYELTAQETEVTPGRLSGVTVCIDPGHQGTHRTVTEPRGPGLSGSVSSSGGMAQGVVTRRKESIVVLEVAYLLRDELMRQGATVIMTRDSEEQWLSNIDRCDVAEQAGADFMLRLHCDNRENQNAYGIGIFCPLASTYAKEVAEYEVYKVWADALLAGMKRSVGYELSEKTGRTYFNNNYVGNNWAKMPCFLIELGFMSNNREDQLMSHPHYQQLLAEGMAQGVYDVAVIQGLIQE